jgi:hypothetical protein
MIVNLKCREDNFTNDSNNHQLMRAVETRPDPVAAAAEGAAEGGERRREKKREEEEFMKRLQDQMVD